MSSVRHPIYLVAISLLLIATGFVTLTHTHVKGDGPLFFVLSEAPLLLIGFAVSHMNSLVAPTLITILTLGVGGFLTYSYWSTTDPSRDMVQALAIAVYAVLAVVGLVLMARNPDNRSS